MATKKLSLEVTPTQARNLVWAINMLEGCYEGGSGIDSIDRDVERAIRGLAGIYEAADDFAVANGK